MVLTDSSHPAPEGRGWSGVRIGRGWWGVLAGQHPAPSEPRLSRSREGAEVRGGADLV